LTNSKLKLASDIEAVGFYDKVNSKKDVHCLCSIDVDTEEVYLFHDHPEFDGAEVVDPYDKKTNTFTYDKHIIDKVWKDNKIPFEAYHDTFTQSKVQWFERPTPKGAKSPHGLKAYGILMGVNKPEVTDWTNIDAFKLHRCIEDCRIQRGTYLMLEKERIHLLDKFGANFEPAFKIENLYAIECFKQEVRGALVDVPHIKRCIKDLDEKIETLRVKIEPELPPTIKGKGPKVSRKEMAEIFGFNSSKIVDEVIKKKKDGSIVDAIVKPYVKPCTKYTVKEKVNKYQGYHPEYEFSPKFDKKTEFVTWRNENYPNTKPKEWVVDKEETLIETIDSNNCKFFGIGPTDTDYVCGPHTKIVITPSTMTQSDVVKQFLIRLGWRYADEWNLKKDVYGNFIKVEQKTTVYWPENAKEGSRLTKVIPKGGYMVSSPKLGEEDYKQLPDGIGKMIAEYNTYEHRRRFLENPSDPDNKGLLSYVREDGRIPCGVNNFGTRSGRGSQRVWVNAPGAKSLYGKEIRKCLIAPEGKVLVGVDMKSAQLSIAAYYANNSDYYNNVATGIEETEDGTYVGETAHCVNARMFGMVTEEQWQEAVRTQDPELIKKLSLIRGDSKGGSFAVIFGASGKKVAVTIGIPESEGHKRKEQFLEQMGLGDTISQLSVFESKYPYKKGFLLPLAFGYWLWNNSPHKSVNTTVQGFEALAQKLAVVRFSKEVERLGLQDKISKVLEVHDELLIETTKGYENKAGQLAGEAYTWAAKQIFNFHVNNPEQFANPNPPEFPIDLNGGYKLGSNYYDVH